jgi:hypothetical protein
VPGWNLNGAPAAALALNTNYLFGNQVLRFSNFSTTQTIVSNAIPINLINHTYEATITPGNLNVAYGTSLTLSVIDTVTGQVLATATQMDNLQRGFSAVAAFTPTTTDPVQLQIVVTPPSGVTTSLDVDAATLNVSFDYGVVAARAWSGGFPGFANFPASVQSVYSAGYLNVANFTVENGSIVQGQGRGTNSSPLYLQYLNGLTVNQVSTSDTGLDTINVDATGVSGSIVISNSTFQDNIPNVTNRMAGPATISFYNTNGNIQVIGNRILGSPEFGIHVDVNNDYSLIVNDNYISQNSVVADAAGIGLAGTSNFQVKGNTIVPQNGEGIAVDGYRGTAVTNGVIQGNYVKVQELPNRETGNGNFARALRMRNTDGPSSSAQTNIDVSGNTLIALVGPGDALTAYTAWITYINPIGAMNNANVNLHDNTIEAIANTADPSYHAVALVIDGSDTGINLKLWNNVLESNDTSLSVGGYNNRTIDGVTLIGNTLDKLASGFARPYTGIQVGYYTTPVSNVQILDTVLENGATAAISWVGSGTKSVQVGTMLNVGVMNSDGSAAVGAGVQIVDSGGNVIYQGTTNSQGSLLNIPVITTTYTQSGIDPSNITTVASGPLTIQVTNGTKKKSLVISPSADELLSVQVTD